MNHQTKALLLLCFISHLTVKKFTVFIFCSQVELLQQQMSVLADNQTHADERYTRAKQENAALQARYRLYMCEFSFQSMRVSSNVCSTEAVFH